ncbi:MAG: hypothetical protein QXI19_08055 [Candidatus Caldarchaeum sp.]
MPKVVGRRRRVLYRLTRELITTPECKSKILDILLDYNSPCDESTIAKMYSMCKEDLTEVIRQVGNSNSTIYIPGTYDIRNYLTNQHFDYYSDYTYWLSLNITDSYYMSRIPKRRYHVGTTPEEFTNSEANYYDANDSLHPALQDLGDQIAWRIVDIMNSLYGNENAYYPLPDNIPEMSDEHVELVCLALERELMREPRLSKDGSHLRPHLQLSKMPQRIKRAIAEWRRAEYYSWGITNEVWRSGKWSVLNVPDDLWEPPVLRNSQG